jgi:hypothetical protein
MISVPALCLMQNLCQYLPSAQRADAENRQEAPACEKRVDMHIQVLGRSPLNRGEGYL